jgi:hypothetical protein
VQSRRSSRNSRSSSSSKSSLEKRLEGAWEPTDHTTLEAVTAYLRNTLAPLLRRLHLRNDDLPSKSSKNTKIAQALRDGTAPHLEAVIFDYVLDSNSMYILADAVHEGYFMVFAT